MQLTLKSIVFSFLFLSLQALHLGCYAAPDVHLLTPLQWRRHMQPFELAKLQSVVQHHCLRCLHHSKKLSVRAAGPVWMQTHADGG